MSLTTTKTIKYGGRNVTLDFMMKDIQEKAVKKTLNVLRRAALDMANNIKSMTPIETGRAKHNWTIGLNGYKRPEYVDYDTEGAGYDPFGRMNPMPLNNMKVTDKISINNETPYIRELENGSSKQAPQGMVRVNLAMWKDYLRLARGDIAAGLRWYEE